MNIADHQQSSENTSSSRIRFTNALSILQGNIFVLVLANSKIGVVYGTVESGTALPMQIHIDFS